MNKPQHSIRDFPRAGPGRSSRSEDERAYFASLIRAEYERCHPDDTFADLQRRARFTKEDKGLLRDWMAVAARRAAAARRGRPTDAPADAAA